MKILHLNTFDIAGGAAQAAWRLHQGLRSAGIDSRMLVQTNASGDPSVSVRDRLFARLLGKYRPLFEILPLLSYRGRPPTHWATEWLPTRINRQIEDYAPDLVHLHWICRGFMSIPDIGRITRPVVWTLHDSWPFTGGCHVPDTCTRYQDRCGCCPQLASSRDRDLSRLTWTRKARRWKALRLTVVTPSEWLATAARTSALFRDRPVEVIPNGIDSAGFQPIPRDEARVRLNLPADRKLVLMSAMNATHDLNKGFRFVAEAGHRLVASGWAGKAELIVVGQDTPAAPVETGLPVRFLGVFNDATAMRLAYSAADVTVMASLQENLPNAIMESMACATPVVAFAIGGVPAMVEHRETGYLARPRDAADLAAGIEELLADDPLRLQYGAASRAVIQTRFDTAVVTGQYASLYERLLSR